MKSTHCVFIMRGQLSLGVGGQNYQWNSRRKTSIIITLASIPSNDEIM
jgi:hypothetical protein